MGDCCCGGVESGEVVGGHLMKRSGVERRITLWGPCGSRA